MYPDEPWKSQASPGHPELSSAKAEEQVHPAEVAHIVSSLSYDAYVRFERRESFGSGLRVLFAAVCGLGTIWGLVNISRVPADTQSTDALPTALIISVFLWVFVGTEYVAYQRRKKTLAKLRQELDVTRTARVLLTGQ